MENLNVMNAPKTSTFQMRINPEVKSQAEQIFQNCGMTLTDAINIFIQQSMNVGGLPFIVTQDSKEALRNQAIAQLMAKYRRVGIPSALKGIGFLKKRCLITLG